MGSSEDEQDRRDNEGPQTEVTLTQGEYLAVMGENPNFFNRVQGDTDYGTDLNHPVKSGIWDGTVAY